MQLTAARGANPPGRLPVMIAAVGRGINTTAREFGPALFLGVSSSPP
jgi:hypothetical protein